jgi:hypothetical protein
MRLSFLISALALLAACNGAIATAPPDDAGNPEKGTDIPEAGATERATDATAADACAPVAFDAAGYVLDAAAASIGTPCLPSLETDSTFHGFSDEEINLSPVAPSGSPTCLIYYFRGLATCPYGQSATGQAPACAAPCTTIGGQPVTGAVEPQCTDRRASETVIWSCRCANEQGSTSDGDSYCACPAGTSCTQAVSSIGASGDDFAGAYCVPAAAAYNPGAACAVSCDPTSAPCP